MAFEVGNKLATGRKDKPWRDAINIALKDGDGLRLRRIAEKVVKLAEEGDSTAYKEVADRLDGKVPQQQIHTGDEDGGAIQNTHEVNVNYVRPEPGPS